MSKKIKKNQNRNTKVQAYSLPLETIAELEEYVNSFEVAPATSNIVSRAVSEFLKKRQTRQGFLKIVETK